MNKLRIAAEYAVLIVDIILGIAFVLLLCKTLEHLSESELIRKEGTSEYIINYIDREDYGAAAKESRKMRLGEKIDEPMQEFYKVGSYADLMFWEKIYAESENESTAEECRKQCEEIKNSLPEYEKVFKKIDAAVEKASSR
ncbi:MAG: hypothetical protein IKN85_12245 [Oscillospiraceae bacterium]|nr:hypothetical protein [Oscillospiraceae bacterium]MBR6836571.1 hypothetical protein [Oscillospiraceae bacterium]